MKLQFIRNSTYYYFNQDYFNSSDATFPVYLVGSIGWGLTPSHQLTQRGPFQQGDTYVGFRLDPRVFQIPIVVPASSSTEMMTRRAKLFNVFRMGDDEVQLRVQWIDGATTYERSIVGHIVGGLTMDTDSTSYNIKASIQIKANDPTWFDTYGTYVQLSGTVAGTPTPYPKPYPVPYGATAIDQSTAITYDGTWDSYPIIQATGPITNLTMVDTLGHQIVVSGTIPAGDTWTFDLTYGKYTVTNSAGANQFGALSINSDLVNWRIYAVSDAVPAGVNTVSISGTGTTIDSLVTLFFYTRYIGV